MAGVENFAMEEGPKDKHNIKSSERGNWAKQLDYVMTILGSIVGYGNVWRFPYLCNKNGGGAFLVPYIFFLFTCGLPIFFLEVTAGQFSGKSSVHIWEVCPILKGVGIGQFIASIFSMIAYQQIIIWVIYYIGISCSAALPWTTCNNEWNTDQCQDVTGFGQNNTRTGYGSALLNHSLDSIHNNTMVSEFTFAHTDVEEFWHLTLQTHAFNAFSGLSIFLIMCLKRHKALGMSEGVHEIGQVQWHLALSLVVSWVLIFLCIIKGVHSLGKVVYVTALLPYLLLIVLLVRTSLLPGAVDGILVFLKPDFEKILDVQVWLEALIQVFYSIAAGWGLITNLSSYNRFNDNALRNSIIITCVGEGTSLLCGLVIYTVLGSMAKTLGVGVSEVAASGPGLVFVAYPEGLSKLPVPQLWAFLFFIMMLAVGLDSQFTWVEGLITVMVDQFPHILRKRRLLVTAVVCSVSCLLGLPFTTEGGVYYMQLVDWYIGALCVVLCGILECVTFTWIYGTDRLSKDVELMLGRRTPRILNILLQYITPAFMSVAFVLLLWGFEPPVYGDYVYPTSCLVVGWILAILPVLPIPIVGAYVLYKSKGTILQRLKVASSPEKSWRPAAENYLEVSNEAVTQITIKT